MKWTKTSIFLLFILCLGWTSGLYGKEQKTSKALEADVRQIAESLTHFSSELVRHKRDIFDPRWVRNSWSDRAPEELMPELAKAHRVIGALGNTTAVVTRTFSKGGGRGGLHHAIEYQFFANGHQYRADKTVSNETYARLGLSDTQKIQQGAVDVRIRYIAIGEMYYDILTEQTSLTKSIGTPFLAALIWNAIVFAAAYYLWIKPRHIRWLLQNGAVAEGNIISRRLSDKTGAFFATFRFVDEQTGNEICKEMVLPGREQYDAAISDRSVTVLYDPARPSRFLVYELCGIEVVGAENNSNSAAAINIERA